MTRPLAKRDLSECYVDFVVADEDVEPPGDLLDCLADVLIGMGPVETEKTERSDE